MNGHMTLLNTWCC